jgi:cobalt/nickel transport system permease protein
MHIQDAILSPAVTAATGVVAMGGLAICMGKLQNRLLERTPVLMGVMSAFIFAAQMVNFPLFVVPISGHLLGGVLSAVLLGPWAGAVVIAAVLIVQCLIFQDGGVTALGANFVNMGLIGSIGGYAIYDPIRRAIGGRVGILVGAMAAAWFSVLLASGAFAVELAASGRRADFLNVLALMALVHAAVGIGEALITGLVLRFLLLVRPDLIEDDENGGSASRTRWGQAAVGGLGIALAVAIFLAPFASKHDDGLEWVGRKLGFSKEETPVLAAPIPDYQLHLPGLSYIPAATAMAGALGTLFVFGAGFGLARVFSPRTIAEPGITAPVTSGESSASALEGET